MGDSSEGEREGVHEVLSASFVASCVPCITKKAARGAAFRGIKPGRLAEDGRG